MNLAHQRVVAGRVLFPVGGEHGRHDAIVLPLHLIDAVIDCAQRGLLSIHSALFVGCSIATQVSAVIDAMLDHARYEFSHVSASVEPNGHVCVAIQDAAGANGHQQSRNHAFLRPQASDSILFVVIQ